MCEVGKVQWLGGLGLRWPHRGRLLRRPNRSLGLQNLESLPDGFGQRPLVLPGGQFERFLPLGHGRVGLSTTSQRGAEIIAGVGAVVFDFHCLLKMGDRLVDSSATGQRSAQVVVGVGVIRLDV